jgi:hypothetical protein
MDTEEIATIVTIHKERGGRRVIEIQRTSTQ